MMDKKSGNGFPTKASEGGVQRKQLPYSVETPYGFHLDLDFLKYVDDIEKGNTIKRVHIQRRVKGPPKFSTLPRNFSLPGHGVRPVIKDKDSTWSGTSTLGPKPRSRVTEVQQIFDFRVNEGGSTSQASKGSTSPGSGYVSAKPREEVGKGARGTDEKAVGIQSRPNLLRASSMPVTMQQRKGSDSSSPDRTVGTPENGSTENMFRASPEVTERRSGPQERTGLHQQITVALKRVRELEEQVKTIPELKAQISSLREERERLLIQLQARVQEQSSTSPSTVASSSDGGSQQELEEEKESSSAEESQRLLQQPEKSDNQKEKIESSQEKVQGTKRLESTLLKLDIKDAVTVRIQRGDAEKANKSEERDSVQTLQEKLMALEDKLTQASGELERTNSLLKEQIEENKVKEEKILQLSEGVRVEICDTETLSWSRRESIDTGTVTEKVDFVTRETETESVVTIDQGTDTDKICIEVCVPSTSGGTIDQVSESKVEEAQAQVTVTEAEAGTVSPPRPRANSMERGTVTERVATQDQTTETPVAQRVNQVTETVAETVTNHPQRPRANSMERGTVTERIATQDQTTETPVTQRVHQITETEVAAVTDHPQRPRANSMERGTVTERVDTVDRVTETELARSTDQQTETERRQDDNPVRNAEADSQVGEGGSSERVEDVKVVVSEHVEEKEVKEMNETEQTKQNVVVEVDKESTVATPVIVIEPPKPLQTVKQDKEDLEDLKTNEIVQPQSTDTESTETKQTVVEITEKKQTVEEQTVCAMVKESDVTETVVAVPVETVPVKAVPPVRPQRGRKLSADKPQPSPPQPQAVPVRPRRGSSEVHAQKPQMEPKPEEQVQKAPQPEAQTTPTQISEDQVKQKAPPPSQVEDNTQAKRPESSEEKPKPQDEAKGPRPTSSGVQTRPKTILGQTSTTRRDSKELKATQKGSKVSQPLGRPTRQGSIDMQRRSSGDTQPHKKDSSEAQSQRRSSTETVHRRGSSEAQAARRDAAEALPPRKESTESPTSPAALGQVVTRLTGLLGEQWAQLGSSSGGQQTANQQEAPSTQRQAAGKRAEAAKGAATAKSAGKAAPAAAAAAATSGKPAGKPAASKMSSIQSQLVSSLSVLSAFYSPGQKAAAGKQQEQGLKSIMKKNGVADKQGNKGAKKNLKFVGVNGGYESTSSEESSGDEKPKAEVEEEDSSEPEVEKKQEKEAEPAEKPEETAAAAASAVAAAAAAAAEVQGKDAEASAEGAEGGAVAGEKEAERGLMDPESSQEEQAEQENVDKGFIDACLYVKDRMEEVSSPDKEMRQVLVVLYQEWFRVSSQRDSQADMVRAYLRRVGMTTPTLLPYVVNLTDGNGNMALHYSVSHSNFPVVKLLLDTGLCETDNVNKAGYTPVMLAALTAAESPDDLEVVQQLLNLGDVNARSRQAGQTALMLAVSHGRVAMVKLLLSCGADVNAQDREGSTALMCACEHGHTHIARLLLETGRCDTSLTDKNSQTALSVAEGAAHQDIADLLKSHAETQGSEPPSGEDLL